MKAITSRDLQEDSLTLLEGAGLNGVVILKDGQPVARLLPITESERMPTGGDLIRSYREKIKINGDVFSTGIKWNAESGYSYHPVRDQSDADTTRTSTD